MSSEQTTRRHRAAVVAAALALLVPLLTFLSPASSASAAPLSIKVKGNDLVDGAGSTVQLHGVTRTGTEYKCQQNSGIFEGPTDQASIDVMKSWGINLVRVPLNEHCWLGINGNGNTGRTYQDAIVDYVSRLNANGIYVNLDLHFSEPLGANTSGDPQRQPMANMTYSVPFWGSVAATFKANPAVIFELFNEPHEIDWNCLRNGCSQGNWQAAGYQQMLDAVRDAGATNPVIVSGIDWGHDMRWLLANLPDDSADQLIAGQHLYNFKRCVDEACWKADFTPVAKVMPLVGAEIGQEYCTLDIVKRFMKWMDANDGDGYIPWAFEPGSCPSSGTNQYRSLPMLSDWNGTPSSFGATVKAHYLATAPSATTTTTTRPPTTTTTTSAPTTTTTTPTTTTSSPPNTTTTQSPATTTTTTSAPSSPNTTTRPSTTTTTAPNLPAANKPSGYRVVTANGDVHAFGGATDLGDAPAGAEIASLTSTSTGRGYWLAGTDGRVFTYGDARSFGDMGGKNLNQPITGMAVTPNGDGYWLLGRDGGIFAFGAAPFYGSTGSMKLNAPVVGMTAAPDGKGYWFVASDGGIFVYGASAKFYGSTGSMKLNRPVVGMATAPDGGGYWLVASDGGIFAFGPSAKFYGSTGSMTLNQPVVGMIASPNGDGYRFVASDGGVFAFGNAPFVGSLGASGTSSPVVAIAS